MKDNDHTLASLLKINQQQHKEIERLREALDKQLQWVEVLRRLQRIDPTALDLVQANIEAALKERGDKS